MNDTLKTLTNHRSIRNYTEQPVTDAELDAIAGAAQAAPSSINGQQATIVCVQDKATKKRIAELCGGQPWIDQAPAFLLFCADFHRAHIAAEMHDRQLTITDSAEALIVGACDVGIALANAAAAAESLGLGIVPIGGVRNQPEALIELLGIPRHVFPICGLVVGRPADPSAIKPRLARSAVFHREKYQPDLKPLIEEYDTRLAAHMTAATHGRLTHTWSQTVSGFYDHIYFPDLQPALEKQGFGCK
ncbi:MAG: NADPH-dependent oxidoreductase [Sulfuricellaceae bacterium]